jgi:hypothetical protein
MPHQVDSNMVPNPNLIEHFSIFLSIHDDLIDIYSSSEKSNSIIHDEHYNERKFLQPLATHI